MQVTGAWSTGSSLEVAYQQEASSLVEVTVAEIEVGVKKIAATWEVASRAALWQVPGAIGAAEETVVVDIQKEFAASSNFESSNHLQLA